MHTVYDHAEHCRLVGLDPARLPRHVAVIMDGNGRWAVERGLPRSSGHARGADSVRGTVTECCKLGVGQLTLYSLSVENWKRPKDELDFLMELLKRYLPAELTDEELESGLREIVAATGAASKKDMGKVMKEATARYKGRADGKRIQEIVARLLP